MGTLKRQMKSIEAVQRRATKMLPDLKKLPYSERLKILDLPSIKYRQIRGDLIQTYKIINNIDNLKPGDFFTINLNNTRNANFKLFKEFAKTNTRLNFFSNRITNAWNSLSSNTKSAKSLSSF